MNTEHKITNQRSALVSVVERDTTTGRARVVVARCTSSVVLKLLVTLVVGVVIASTVVVVVLEINDSCVLQRFVLQ